MRYRVSVLQYKPELLQVEANFARISQMLQGAETDLIVLPELALSGYVFADQAEVAASAESIPDGAIFQGFKKLARDLDCSIVYGFAEKAKEHFFNSSALINPDGSYEIYRKIQLFYREKLFFSPGDKPYFVSKAKHGVRIGMMVCFDWTFPEAARSLALQGAQIITHPSNLVLPWCQEAMKTRSLENRVFSITANRTGTETNGEFSEYFTGKSQILGTKGEILIRLSETQESLYTIEIDPFLADNKAVTEHNDAFKDRRTEMYSLQ